MTFAALQDFVPPLAVQLHVSRRGKWRPFGPSAPLGGPGTAWRRGELRTVRLPLADDVPADRVGAAVQSDVLWHAAVVPFAGTSAQRPFPLLSELLPRP